MPPSTRIPPLLQPYVRLPRDDSLLLLTSTLGASANWLVIRVLCDALRNSEDGGADQGHNVVLVSWMREFEFWKQEARKGAGLDLARLTKEGRFAFVDGLSELCLDAIAGSDAPTASNGTTSSSSTPSTTAGIPTQRAPQILPVRGPQGRIVPERGPPQVAAQPTAPAPTSTTMQTSSSTTRPPTGHHTLKSLGLAHLQTTLTTAISSFASKPTQRKTLLILDNPDLLLALSPTLTPSALSSLILTLHTLPGVSHILTHMQSDNPLLSLSTPPQPLEIGHHNLLVKMAHMSSRILGVRVLDTGVARDVSGVVRVTEQRVGWMDLGLEEEGQQAEDDRKGRECLYQVKGDGSVRVFERGAGGEG